METDVAKKNRKAKEITSIILAIVCAGNIAMASAVDPEAIDAPVTLVKEETKTIEERLYNAVIGNDIDALQDVLAIPEIDVNMQNDYSHTALYHAAFNNHLAIMRALLDKGADVNLPGGDGCTPLHAASFSGHTKAARMLLDVSEIKVDEKSNGGTTPLHFAAKNGHRKIIYALLDKGAKVKERDHAGWTLLHYAAVGCDIKTIKDVLGMPEVDVNAQDNNGGTALHYLVSEIYEGKKPAIRALVKRQDFDPNIQDKFGRTVLHLASFDGDPEIVAALIKKGANVKIKDKKGLRPICIAVMKKNKKAVRVLAEKECKNDLASFLKSFARFLKNS